MLTMKIIEVIIASAGLEVRRQGISSKILRGICFLRMARHQNSTPQIACEMPKETSFWIKETPGNRFPGAGMVG